MKVPILILVSALVPFAAAYLAFRMIRTSRHAPGWMLISSALVLMGFHRMMSLLAYLLPATNTAPRGTDATALVISILILGGIILLRRSMLREKQEADRLRDSERKYRALSDQLGHRVRQKAQRLSETTDLLQAYSHARSEFLSKMSHEVRTPLNAVIGFSDILLSGMDGNLNPEQKKDLQLVFNSAQRLLQLINDILDFSRLEDGKIPLQTEKVSLSQMVAEALSGFTEKIREKGLELTQKIPMGLPPIHGDPARVRQILTHLIGTAIKFTHQGRITIQAQCLDLDEQGIPSTSAQTRRFVRITVQDTGIGIPEKDLASISKGSQQQVSELFPQDAGTGLGLAIARSLVELHGGTMNMQSRPGEGSRFWFTLPTEEASVIPEDNTDL